MIIKEVVERYLDCGTPRSGFARNRCPDCHAEHLLMFSCKTQGFCTSCHAKKLEEWGDWVREKLLLNIPHHQVVFTILKTLRIFFKFRRKLLGELRRCAVKTRAFYFETLTGEGLVLAVLAAYKKLELSPHALIYFYPEHNNFTSLCILVYLSSMIPIELCPNEFWT